MSTRSTAVKTTSAAAPKATRPASAAAKPSSTQKARGTAVTASAEGKRQKITSTPAPVLENLNAKVTKDKKPKVIRDSFSIPKNEFAQIAEIKSRALGLGVEVKKSELLRAGLLILAQLNDARLKQAIAAVPTLKTGRPTQR